LKKISSNESKHTAEYFISRDEDLVIFDSELIQGHSFKIQKFFILSGGCMFVEFCN